MGLKASTIEELRNHPEFKAALEEVAEGVKPRLGCLRDGVILGGYSCRLTIGKMALLGAADSKIFRRKGDKGADEPIEIDDIFEAVLLLSDELLDEMIWIADKPALLKKRVVKFRKRFGIRSAARLCATFTAWLSEQAALLPDPSDDKDDTSAPRPEWYLEVVDLLANQYKWREQFILWDLSLIRAARYQECIVCRVTGRPMVADISKPVIEALELMLSVTKGNNDGQSKT